MGEWRRWRSRWLGPGPRPPRAVFGLGGACMRGGPAPWDLSARPAPRGALGFLWRVSRAQVCGPLFAGPGPGPRAPGRGRGVDVFIMIDFLLMTNMVLRFEMSRLLIVY